MKENGINLFDHKKMENNHSCYFTLDETKNQNYFYTEGLIVKNKKVWNMMEYPWLFISGETRQPSWILITLEVVKNRSPKPEQITKIQKKIYLVESGMHKLCLPVSSFDLPESESYYLEFVRGITVESEHEMTITQARLKAGKEVSVQCPIMSKAVKPEETAVYPITLINCTDKKQRIALDWKPYGWHALNQVRMPEMVELKPYEETSLEIGITMTNDVALGGYEKHKIVFTPEGRGAHQEIIELSTIRELPHPLVIMDKEELLKVKDKIDQYPWAREKCNQWINAATDWVVPKINLSKDYLFVTKNAHDARGAATCFQLTGRRDLGLKVVEFLKELSNPRKGYLRLPRACNQELVHEGEFFKSIAIAYDMVYDFEELTKEDHANIECVLRKVMSVFDHQLRKGEISNWTLAEISGGLYCACVLQDYHQISRFLYGVGGAAEHLGRGTFADGWWFEASIGYNLMSAGLFSEIAQVVKHFGINFKDIKVPASYARAVNSAEVLKDGLCLDAWGPNNKNYRSITMLWDSLLNYFDYRGVIFAVNDSAELHVEGAANGLFDPRYDMAYYLYHKPEYAQLMRNVAADKRDLLFGVGEIPQIDGEKTWLKSCYSDNAGACVLRSQKEGRPDREQIQIGMKYGSHGGAHGHYDRVSMTSIMRYGRSLTNPENIWYSYHTLMYKFYVQNSINHNMVTVDLKQQDPVEPKRIMFYTGSMIQAIALENYGPWCNPPYGGWQVGDDKTLATRSFKEARYVPIPEQEPEYSSRTEFTEDILTRRLTVVTDDFVVNFDYAKGETEHIFDCLHHLQGLKEEASHIGTWINHTDKLDDSPLGSGQFITDCDWYETIDGAKLRFEVEFGEDKNNGHKWVTQNRTGFNEIGIVKTDLYLVYPKEASIVIGADPENQSVNKQLWYEVMGDDKVLASGNFGAWILGKDRIDVDITGRSQLTLKTKINQVPYEDEIYLPMEKTIFWGNPVIELMDGTIISLSDLPYQTEHIDLGNGVGVDYKGGKVKIQGELFDKAMPAEPLTNNEDAVITVDLKGLHAKRLICCIGGDYPVGDESGKRRTIAYRKKGKEASFITVLEPVEDNHLINKVNAASSKRVEVELKDGRFVVIGIDDFHCEAGNPFVTIKEFQKGQLIREEISDLKK